MNRQRTRGSITSRGTYPAYVKDSNCSQPSWTPAGTSPLLATGSWELMDDVLVPSFHKRRAAGEIFFNPMLKRREEVIFNDGPGPEVWSVGNTCVTPVPLKGKTKWESSTATFEHASIGGNSTGHMPPLTQLIDSAARYNALVEASTRVHSEIGRGGSNLFESIAEYKQTVGMVRDIFHAGNRTIDRYILSDINLRNAPRSIAKRTNNAYLMWRYGIKPLISDVNSIIDGLSKNTGKRRETVRGYANLSTNQTVTAQSSAYGSGILVEVRKQTTDSISIRGMALTEYVAYWGDNFGLSAKNFLTVPLELIPYSFVANWFVNIEDLFGAAIPTPGVNTLGSCLVEERKWKTVTSIVNCTGGSNYTIQRQPSGSASYEVVTKCRMPLLSPGFVVRSDFGFDRDTRAADAIALVSQKIKMRPELRIAWTLMQNSILDGAHASFSF